MQPNHLVSRLLTILWVQVNDCIVTPQVTPQVERLLGALVGDMSREQLQKALGLQDRK